MPALYLIRHGHTEYSDLGAIAGSSDVALSQAGRDAVTVAAGSLDIDSITTFYASTLTRAIDTASLLGSDTIVEDARLVELDFGDWEGKTWQQVHDDDPDHLSEWSENWVERAPPGGETFQALANRADDWLQDIKALPDDHRLVVAAHGGTIRALLCLALELPLSCAMRFSADYAHVTLLSLSRGGSGCDFLNASGFRHGSA